MKSIYYGSLFDEAPRDGTIETIVADSSALLKKKKLADDQREDVRQMVPQTLDRLYITKNTGPSQIHGDQDRKCSGSIRKQNPFSHWIGRRLFSRAAGKGYCRKD